MRTTIRSKQLMAATRHQSCMKCGTSDGTIVRAHYSGQYQQRFGKGTGTKGHDLIASYLCFRCHSAFDQYKGARDGRDLEFLVLCNLTIVEDVHSELILIPGWNL